MMIEVPGPGYNLKRKRIPAHTTIALERVFLVTQFLLAHDRRSLD